MKTIFKVEARGFPDDSGQVVLNVFASIDGGKTWVKAHDQLVKVQEPSNDRG